MNFIIFLSTILHFLLITENNKNKLNGDCFIVTLFRWLRMLSLVLGSEITDASVAAIASSYPNLELLDLSGYVFPSKSSCIQLLLFFSK
jgi:hypothetical protein